MATDEMLSWRVNMMTWKYFIVCHLAQVEKELGFLTSSYTFLWLTVTSCWVFTHLRIVALCSANNKFQRNILLATTLIFFNLVNKLYWKNCHITFLTLTIISVGDCFNKCLLIFCNEQFQQQLTSDFYNKQRVIFATGSFCNE